MNEWQGIRFMVAAQPHTFSIFEVSTDIPGRWLPVLMLDLPDGTSEPLMELVACLYNAMETGMQLERMRSITNTVGLLHDFLILVNKDAVVTPDRIPNLILKFFTLRSTGTVIENGRDPYGLHWPPIRNET
jgi:hypothetical protein